MKKFALIAAVAATVAAPVFADTASAIRHFNQDLDTVGERSLIPSSDARVFASTSGISPLGGAFEQFNMVQDSAGDLRGVSGATVVLNTASGEASDIFARLRAESLEDE